MDVDRISGITYATIGHADIRVWAGFHGEMHIEVRRGGHTETMLKLTADQAAALAAELRGESPAAAPVVASKRGNRTDMVLRINVTNSSRSAEDLRAAVSEALRPLAAHGCEVGEVR